MTSVPPSPSLPTSALSDFWRSSGFWCACPTADAPRAPDDEYAVPAGVTGDDGGIRMARIEAATLVWSIEDVSYVNIISRQVAMAFLRANGVEGGRTKREGGGYRSAYSTRKCIKEYNT